MIEILVAIGIIAIMAAIALPNFSEYRADSRQSTVLNDFIASLQLARSEAIRRGSSITVCHSADGASCGGNWENGWIIFTDTNGDGVVDPGEAIVQTHGPLTGMTLRGNNNVTNRVTFNSRGYTPGSNGTLRFCDSRGTGHMRTAIIAVSGRIRRGESSGVCP